MAHRISHTKSANCTSHFNCTAVLENRGYISTTGMCGFRLFGVKKLWFTHRCDFHPFSIIYTTPAKSWWFKYTWTPSGEGQGVNVWKKSARKNTALIKYPEFRSDGPRCYSCRFVAHQNREQGCCWDLGTTEFLRPTTPQRNTGSTDRMVYSLRELTLGIRD